MSFGLYGKWMYENIGSYRHTVDNLIPRGVREFHDRELDYWTSPRGEYELKAFMIGLPFGIGGFLKNIMEHNDDMQDMDHTLDRYGLGYEDVNLITRTIGFNSGGAVSGSAMNFISSNVGRLYR